MNTHGAYLLGSSTYIGELSRRAKEIMEQGAAPKHAVYILTEVIAEDYADWGLVNFMPIAKQIVDDCVEESLMGE